MINLGSQNNHWIELPNLVYAKYRQLYTELEISLENHLMTFLIGPRRVGKSVLLKQLIYNLIQKFQTNPRQILFWEFSPNDNKEVLNEVIEKCLLEVANKKERFYLFLDEIQYISGWEGVTKLVYDQYPNAKIVLTGSLSLSHKRKMEESLAGRFLPKYLFPLNFKEYLEFTSDPLLARWTEKMDLITQDLFISNLSSSFHQFLSSGRYPDTLNLSPKEASYYLETVQYQTLSQDALNYFSIEKVNVLQALFDYYKTNSGSETSFNNLSKILSQTSSETISKYTDILELLRLIYIVPNTDNPLKVPNSNKKIYTSSTWTLLSKFIPNTDNLGLVVESYVLEQLLIKYGKVSFCRNRNKEIDFIVWDKIVEGGHIYAGSGFEIKYRNLIDTKTEQVFVQLCQQLNLKPHLIVQNPEKKQYKNPKITYLTACLV